MRSANKLRTASLVAKKSAGAMVHGRALRRRPLSPAANEVFGSGDMYAQFRNATSSGISKMCRWLARGDAPSGMITSRSATSGRLHRFDQVATAGDTRPCLIEICNEQLEGRRLETVAQSRHVAELIKRIMNRWIAAAPEAPALLGTKFIQDRKSVVK